MDKEKLRSILELAEQHTRGVLVVIACVGVYKVYEDFKTVAIDSLSNNRVIAEQLKKTDEQSLANSKTIERALVLLDRLTARLDSNDELSAGNKDKIKQIDSTLSDYGKRLDKLDGGK